MANDLVHDLQQFAQRIQEASDLEGQYGVAVQDTMQEALGVVRDSILSRMPVDVESRLFRGSLATGMRGSPIHLYGEVIAEKVIATPPDVARKLGDRYPDDIMKVAPWLQMRLGVPYAQADQMVDELRVKLRKFDSRAELAFSEGFDAARPAVDKMFEKLLDTIGEQVMK